MSRRRKWVSAVPFIEHTRRVLDPRERPRGPGGLPPGM